MTAAKAFVRSAFCGLFTLLACPAPPAAASDEVWAAAPKARPHHSPSPFQRARRLVSHVNNIQAMGGPPLDSGQMAVVHFDKSGAVVVDGTITVP